MDVKLLIDLKVSELRAELEKRNIDKTGVRQTLIDRLKKALTDEGLDPLTYRFSHESVPLAEQVCQFDDDSGEDKNSLKSGAMGANESELECVVTKDSIPKEEDHEDVPVVAQVEQTPPFVVEVEDPEEDFDYDLKSEKIISENGEANNSEHAKLESNKRNSISPSGSKKSVAPLNTEYNNLWISNIPKTTKAVDLKSLFSKHGKVVTATVVMNTRTPRGCFGLLKMATVEDANACIAKINGTHFNGSFLKVEATKKELPDRSSKKETKSPVPRSKHFVRSTAVRRDWARPSRLEAINLSSRREPKRVGAYECLPNRLRPRHEWKFAVKRATQVLVMAKRARAAAESRARDENVLDRRRNSFSKQAFDRTHDYKKILRPGELGSSWYNTRGRGVFRRPYNRYSDTMRSRYSPPRTRLPSRAGSNLRSQAYRSTLQSRFDSRSSRKPDLPPTRLSPRRLQSSNYQRPSTTTSYTRPGVPFNRYDASTNSVRNYQSASYGLHDRGKERPKSFDQRPLSIPMQQVKYPHRNSPLRSPIRHVDRRYASSSSNNVFSRHNATTVLPPNTRHLNNTYTQRSTQSRKSPIAYSSSTANNNKNKLSDFSGRYENSNVNSQMNRVGYMDRSREDTRNTNYSNRDRAYANSQHAPPALRNRLSINGHRSSEVSFNAGSRSGNAGSGGLLRGNQQSFDRHSRGVDRSRDRSPPGVNHRNSGNTPSWMQVVDYGHRFGGNSRNNFPSRGFSSYSNNASNGSWRNPAQNYQNSRNNNSSMYR